MRSGGCAGSGRALRLDPFGLPVRFSASDAAADGRVREIELHRERVVLRRSLAGMRMALNMPVTAFDGISLRLVPGERGAEDALAVVLEHTDPSLTLPLYLTARPDEALAEWRAWSEVLGVPLLLTDNRAGAAYAQLGQLGIERPRPRRRRRSALKKRRPSILLRRRYGKVTEATPVHRASFGFLSLQSTGRYLHRRNVNALPPSFISIRSASSLRNVYALCPALTCALLNRSTTR